MLSDITADSIMLLESKMREAGRKEATIKGYLAHLHGALTWAESAGLLESIPWPKRKRRKRKK